MTGKVHQPVDELQEILDARTTLVRDRMNDLLVAQIEGDQKKVLHAQQALGDVLIESAALSDMLGRRRLWLEYDAKTGVRSPVVPAARTFAAGDAGSASALGGLESVPPLDPTAPPPPPLPDAKTPVAPVPFAEAITALLKREPRLAVGWKEVQRVYTRERGFSLAKVTSAKLVEAVTDKVQIALASGASPTRVQDEIKQLAEANELPFTNGYVETVYRTNMNTAYNAGRMRQARAPEVRATLPGFRYDTAGPSTQQGGDTRPNHAALDGFVAAQNDPVWNECSPPLGYNCRCALVLVTRRELEQAGVIRDGQVFQQDKPPGGGPDKGFLKENRTDAEVYPPGPQL